MEQPQHRNGLVFTGERFVPGAPDEDPRLRAEHLLRYAACTGIVRGKDVLDIACGEGYGSAMLAKSAARVMGMDISAEAVEHAAATYEDVATLRFETASAKSLHGADESFDVVVSFETIEHLSEADQERFMQEVRRVLRPDGLFIASTPNAKNYDETLEVPNPFHLHELDEDGFLGLLQSFKVFSLYRQSMMAFTAIWSTTDRDYALLSDLVPDPRDDTYLIAVAGRENAQPPETSLASLWYDKRLGHAATVDMLSQWGRDSDARLEELTAWARELDDEIRRRGERIVALQEELEERTVWALDMARELSVTNSSLLWRSLRALHLAPRSHS
jgi:O-antigen biosynthesis protein